MSPDHSQGNIHMVQVIKEDTILWDYGRVHAGTLKVRLISLCVYGVTWDGGVQQMGKGQRAAEIGDSLQKVEGGRYWQRRQR